MRNFFRFSEMVTLTLSLDEATYASLKKRYSDPVKGVGILIREGLSEDEIVKINPLPEDEITDELQALVAETKKMPAHTFTRLAA